MPQVPLLAASFFEAPARTLLSKFILRHYVMLRVQLEEVKLASFQFGCPFLSACLGWPIRPIFQIRNWKLLIQSANFCEQKIDLWNMKMLRLSTFERMCLYIRVSSTRDKPREIEDRQREFVEIHKIPAPGECVLRSDGRDTWPPPPLWPAAALHKYSVESDTSRRPFFPVVALPVLIVVLIS